MQKIVNDFKSNNPKATDIKTNVVLTTHTSNASFIQKVSDGLRAAGIKTTVLKDDKYVTTNGRKDFDFTTKVQGVIK